jgi:hypothetical protein
MIKKLVLSIERLTRAAGPFYAVRAVNPRRVADLDGMELWVSRGTLSEVEAVAAEMIRSEFQEEEGKEGGPVGYQAEGDTIG